MCMLVIASWVLCSCAVHSKRAEHPRPIVSRTDAFILTVMPPATGVVGQELTATVKLEPKGGYKINMEYPHKLKVTGPQGATPKEVTLRSKQAAVFSESALVFEPVFKIAIPGNHTFEGVLRFSLCTNELCEMKSRPLSWQARVSGQ